VRSGSICGRASLGGVIAFALCPAIVEAGNSVAPEPYSMTAAQQVLRVADSIQDFRDVFAENHETALAKYGTEAARARFRELDRWLWYGVPPRFGWAFFVNLSVVAFAPPDGDVNLVGFFNPWCDAVLITAWRGAGAGAPRIFDAEVIASEWLRDGASLDETRPAWLLREGFRPLSAVRLTAETIARFESRFAPGRRADWRRSLPRLSDPAALTRTNYLSVAGRLITTLSSVRDFVTARDDQGRRLGAVREALARVQEQGAAGNGAALARSAKMSLPAMEAAAAAIPAAAWKRLVVAFAVQAKDGTLVLMVPRDAPGLVLSFFFRTESGPSVSLTRMDVLMVQAFLEQVRAPATRRGKGAP